MLGRFNSKNLKRGISYFKRNGFSSLYYKVIERLQRDDNEAGYTQKVIDSKLTTAKIISQKQAEFDKPYLISILVPAYNPEEETFVKLLESVAAQTYSNWELIIADAGNDNKTKSIIKDFVARHSLDPKGRYDNPDFRKKIVYKHLEENRGISLNTNEALKLANGKYIALLDHDDELTEDALYEVICAINGKYYSLNGKPELKVKRPKLIYSDEDKVSFDNKSYFDYHQKYDFDPVMLLTNNYICHLTVVDAELARAIGGFDNTFDGSQDFDFVLRCVEQISTEEICHIPKVLYHWRSSKASTAENPEAKLYAYEAGKKAVKAHLSRMGIDATVENTQHLGFFLIDFAKGNGTICRLDRQKFSAMNQDVFDSIPEEYIMVLSDNLSYDEKSIDELFKVMVLPGVGASTGKIINKKKIESAGFNKDALGGVKPCFAGMNMHFSGYLHRASILRCVDAYDTGCVLLKRNALKWNGDGPVLKEEFRCVYVPNALFYRK